MIAARDGKGNPPGLIGAEELKAIFGVFDVVRTGVISLSQYKEGEMLPRVETLRLCFTQLMHAFECLRDFPTQFTLPELCTPSCIAAMKAAGVPPGLYSEKPAGFLMGTEGRIKLETFIEEGCVFLQSSLVVLRACPDRSHLSSFTCFCYRCCCC